MHLLSAFFAFVFSFALPHPSAKTFTPAATHRAAMSLVAGSFAGERYAGEACPSCLIPSETESSTTFIVRSR